MVNLYFSGCLEVTVEKHMTASTLAGLAWTELLHTRLAPKANAENTDY